ncbi:MAG: VanW family protein [Chloroflexi bacterium]|nr:VanW family protein [Chloroflexota bacterium]
MVQLSDQKTSPLPLLAPAAGAAGSSRWWPLALLAGVVAVGLALASVAAASYVYAYRDRVLPGISIAGVELGGLTEADASAAVGARLASYTATPLMVQAGAARLPVTPADAGVRYDVPAMVQEALRVGRDGSPAERLAAWSPLGRRAQVLQPVGSVDQATLLQALAPLLREVNRPAVDATLHVSAERGLAISPARAGQMVDLTAATRAVQARAAALSTEPVTLPLQDLPPVTTETAFGSVKDAADALLRQPLRLTSAVADGRVWTVAPADLVALLVLTGDEHRPVALDEGRLAGIVQRAADEVNRPSRDAELAIEDNAPRLMPHADGVAVEVAASVAAINRAVGEGRHEAALVTSTVRPAVVTADLEPVRAQVARLLDRPVKVSAANITQTLTRADLAALLSVTPRPEAATKADLAINRDAADTLLSALARQVNREARAPVFKYLGGKVTQTAEPLQGRRLDEAAALTTLSDGVLHADTTAVTLPVTVVTTPLGAADPSQIVIRDVLATGTTYYGFSLPERKHNVELATQRLNGTLVPPGELFSFNRAVGRVNTASGYRTGYGIVLTNGAVQTVPSVGGGICQVATTVFHAAFRSGVPIGERNWHFYWIPTYGQAPSGMTGLDATVDEDYGLDFTFRNTTGHWIALETGYDGQNMRITLRGVNPGWDVRIAGPQISNVTPHDPTPVEREDDSLPVGRRVQVESARDGMDVSITRTVVKDGQAVDQRTFRSHYAPSQNVTLVGTGAT